MNFVKMGKNGPKFQFFKNNGIEIPVSDVTIMVLFFKNNGIEIPVSDVIIMGLFLRITA